MKIKQCAICGKNEKTEVFYEESIDFTKVDKKTFSARRTPEKVHYRLWRCRNCGLIISSPILSPEKIKLLYRQSTVTYQAEISSLKETYGYYLTKTFSYLPPNPRLLEIGCGNGFFLEEARELGIKDIFGIEPAKEAVDQAPKEIKKRIITDFFPSSEIKSEDFDIICLFQTLDHIINPNLFLRECYKALRRGGIILCIVHDTEAFSAKLLGERSPIFDIEHIYLFNKKNLGIFFEKNGFSTLEIFSVKNSYPLVYWVRMFPLPETVKRVVLRVIKFSNLDKLKIALYAGNIGIVAQK